MIQVIFFFSNYEYEIVWFTSSIFMAALWKMLVIWLIQLIQARRPAKFSKILQRQERIILWLVSSLVLFLFSVVTALDSGQQLVVLTDDFFSTGLTLLYFR